VVRFRLFGFPVRVSILFLIMAVLLGRGRSAAELPVWVVIVFVSVLVHELGHAFAARAFGQEPSILLHGMGGLTSWHPSGVLAPGRRLLVSAAGPVAGLSLAAVSFVLGLALTADESAARGVADEISSVNVWWFVFNVLPMLPLDGGSVMASAFDLLAPGRGLRAARYVSIGVALAVGAAGLFLGSPWILLLCALFAYQNVTALQQRAQPAAPIDPPLGEKPPQGTEPPPGP
jgi:Zn-dependent protease